MEKCSKTHPRSVPPVWPHTKGYEQCPFCRRWSDGYGTRPEVTSGGWWQCPACLGVAPWGAWYLCPRATVGSCASVTSWYPVESLDGYARPKPGSMTNGIWRHALACRITTRQTFAWVTTADDGSADFACGVWRAGEAIEGPDAVTRPMLTAIGSSSWARSRERRHRESCCKAVAS